MAFRIAWRHWGSRTAIGTGRTWIFAPYNVKGKRRRGGYYAKPVRIELRASNLGHCKGSGEVAYRTLRGRVPTRPGGRLGGWGNWSFTGTICHS